MPKMKTHKASRKRVKVTARGKLRRNRAGARHLLSGKSAKRKRHLKRPACQGGREADKLLRLIGEG
jgi:large subunit ribosomal protein L35